MTSEATAQKPRGATLRKAIKAQLPGDVGRVFVSIPGFLDADRVMDRLRASLPGVELQSYWTTFASLEDWHKRRREVIKQIDALIIAIGHKRNAPPGVVRELHHARQHGKPIFLFNTQTGLLEPLTRWREEITFLATDAGLMNRS